MLEEPDAFARCAVADRRGALVHERERLLIRHRRVANPPFDFVCGCHAAGHGSRVKARQVPLRDPRRLRITQRTDQGTCMAKLSISQAWDETRLILERDGKLIAAVALALFVLPGIVLNVAVPKMPTGQMREPGAWMLIAFA